MSVLTAPEQTQNELNVRGVIDPPHRSEPPARDDYAASHPFSLAERVCRHIVRHRFELMPVAEIELVDNRQLRSGRSRRTPAIHVHDPRFFRRAVFSGSLGVAESYLRGEWSANNLVELMRALTRNMDTAGQVDRGVARLLHPLRSGLNWLHRNTRAGSRRNIAAHYDLSNEFFSLMLDPTMTYSSGIFENRAATMEQASRAKYERICRKLELTADDHVLEIGTGWGGFAIYAAKQYGCRITTTTISQQQHDCARDRIRQEGLTDHVRLLFKDYRDLAGHYDRLVSIEMIESVGERYLEGYFRQCSRLLKPDGMMLLQAIMIPDHRYESYRRSVDFIRRFIFPGGFLPSFSAIGQALRRGTDFRLFHSEEFGPHYADTLARWRSKFWRNIDRVRELGFDNRFIRMWHYYLCYCEAGFHERQISVAQLLLTKPACRRDPILGNP